ncbi:MAG: hypothetical protein E3K37_13655 [Candidatus Kuenenia sp.]|nr:hypothetical protein [Candidatus Kuenenia hertensis]
MDKTNEVCSRIIGVLSSDRCPVCAMLYQDEFDSLCRWAGKSGEAYRDSEQRIHLVNSGGFCNYHFWQFQKISSHYGSANVCVDLLGKLLVMLNSGKYKRNLNILSAENTRKCPLCYELKQKEADYLKELVVVLEDDGVKTKYVSGCGVCMPHFIKLMDYSNDKSLLEFLFDTQITQIARIKSDAESFIRKMNPSSRWEQTKAEKKSWLLAIEKIVGRNGV